MLEFERRQSFRPEVEPDEAPLEPERRAEALKIARERLDEGAAETVRRGQNAHSGAPGENDSRRTALASCAEAVSGGH